MKLAIATDAISADFETAVLLGLEWGLEWFELKRIHHKRVPDITDSEVTIVENVLRAHAVRLSTLAPGLFKVLLEPTAIRGELERFERALVLAHRLNVHGIVVFGFERDANRSEEDAVHEVIDILGQAAERAAHEGVTLFLENDRGMWAERPEVLRRIVAGVNAPSLRLNWDPCNLIAADSRPPFPDCFEHIREFVGHLHVKDAVVGADGRMGHAMMGSGHVDWIGQFAALHRDGYEGFCVVEPHFGSRVDSSRRHILETRRAVRLARVRLDATARPS